MGMRPPFTRGMSEVRSLYRPTSPNASLDLNGSGGAFYLSLLNGRTRPGVQADCGLITRPAVVSLRDLGAGVSLLAANVETLCFMRTTREFSGFDHPRRRSFQIQVRGS